MRLAESLEEDIIQKYQYIINSFRILDEECDNFKTICASNENLKNDASYLADFCHSELGKKVKSMQDAILDEYYPKDYAEKDDDFKEAGEKYRDSLEIRDSIFKNALKD